MCSSQKLSKRQFSANTGEEERYFSDPVFQFIQRGVQGGLGPLLSQKLLSGWGGGNDVLKTEADDFRAVQGVFC